MNHLPFRRVLALAPHTDDAEFGAGGTIARFVEEGAVVRVLAFSACERSVPSEWPYDVLRAEAAEAAQRLGVAESSVLEFDVRTFGAARQDVLDIILTARREFEPDLILAPSSTDSHQDHATVHAEAGRASRGVTLLGYEIPWNCRTFTASAHVRLDPGHAERKIAALACYRSQSGKPYASEEAILGLLAARGVAAGSRYAEAFEVIRWVA